MNNAAIRHLRILLLAVPLILMIGAKQTLAQWGDVPPEPVWGDYDDGHVWHDASWWGTNHQDWLRLHHPEWWGDYYQNNWYPAGWWWTLQRQTALDEHPEWWGDSYQGVWYPAGWWWQFQPDWMSTNYPEWWGEPYEGVWYPAGWWCDGRLGRFFPRQRASSAWEEDIDSGSWSVPFFPNLPGNARECACEGLMVARKPRYTALVARMTQRTRRKERAGA